MVRDAWRCRVGPSVSVDVVAADVRLEADSIHCRTWRKYTVCMVRARVCVHVYTRVYTCHDWCGAALVASICAWMIEYEH